MMRCARHQADSIRLIQKARSGGAKGRRELFKNENRRVSSTPFDVADVGAVNAGLLGVGFLAPAFFLAKPTEVACQARANIHRRSEARQLLIDLKTMSENSA